MTLFGLKMDLGNVGGFQTGDDKVIFNEISKYDQTWDEDEKEGANLEIGIDQIRWDVWSDYYRMVPDQLQRHVDIYSIYSVLSKALNRLRKIRIDNHQQKNCQNNLVIELNRINRIYHITALRCIRYVSCLPKKIK